MARRGDSPQLQAMRAKLHAIDAQIAELRLERQALRRDMAVEQARVTHEAAQTDEGFELNVITRLDQQQTVSEIAAALGAPSGRVERAAAKYREAQGVTIRRGRRRLR